MNNYPKWNIQRYPHISDYILQCFRQDLDRDETYWAVSSYLLLKNKSQRQELSDYIAQLDSMDVFAKGRIPKEVA